MVSIFPLILTLITLLSGILWCLNKYLLNIKYDEYHPALKAKNKSFLNNKNKKILIKIKKKLTWIEDGASTFPLLLIILTIRSFIYEPFRIPSGSMMPTLLIGDFILVEKFSYGIKDPIFHNTLIKTGHPKYGDIAVFKYPKDPSLDYIKRIIGLPGDKITYNPFSKEIFIQPNYCNFRTNSRISLPIKYSNFKLSNFIQAFTFNNKKELKSSFIDISKEKIKSNGVHLLERKEILGNTKYNILILPKSQDRLDVYYRQQNQKIATWIVPKKQYFMMGDNRDNSADSRYWGFVPENNLLGRAKIIWMSLEKQEEHWPTGIRLKRIGKIN